MRIVSQNKEVDVNYDRVDIQLNDRSLVTYWGEREIHPKFVITASGRTLGDYPTKERALEVMEEIREQAGKNAVFELGMMDKINNKDKLFKYISC